MRRLAALREDLTRMRRVAHVHDALAADRLLKDVAVPAELLQQ